MPKQKLTKRADGRYSSQVYLGIVDGKRKYKTVYGSSTKEVNEKARQVKTAIGKGLEITSQKDTFEVWLNHWLSFKKTTVSDRHMVTLNSLSKHLTPLYPYVISKINPVDIQNVINKDSHLSRKTLQEILHVASGVFEYAIKNRILDFNPAQYVEIPAAAKKKEERRALTEKEQQAILNVEHRAKTAALIMMCCGLRRGEVIPLLWTDIDFKNRIIRITKSVTFVSNGAVVKPSTKTDAGIRDIVMPKMLSDYLSELPKSSIYVCPSQRNTLLSDTAWKRMWDSYQKAIEKYLTEKKTPYEPFTAHCLRHTYATNLVLSGVDIITAKSLLGHANVQTTLDIYTHVNEKHQKKNINKLNKFMSKIG